MVGRCRLDAARARARGQRSADGAYLRLLADAGEERVPTNTPAFRKAIEREIEEALRQCGTACD